jgi:hypothetical protein
MVEHMLEFDIQSIFRVWTKPQPLMEQIELDRDFPMLLLRCVLIVENKVDSSESFAVIDNLYFFCGECIGCAGFKQI